MLKDDFLHYIGSERNYSERTLKTYNQSLTLFQRHMEAQGRPIDWTAVEEGDIREWMVAMMNNGSAPTTVNNRLSALRSFYRFLIGRDLTRHDPTQRIEGPKKQKPLPHFIKESEMDRLLDHTAFPDTYEGHRDHAILQLFYTTGMRLAELVGLDTGDIDFGNHTVKVTGKRELTSITIDPQVVDPDDIEMLQDLIQAAVNEALRKGEEAREAAMNRMAPGMGGLF